MKLETSLWTEFLLREQAKLVSLIVIVIILVKTKLLDHHFVKTAWATSERTLFFLSGSATLF